MSYVSLARKYRPRRFVDMVGQESTTLALTNAIRLRREPHSVIFTGVRGVGKTTSARIYAKALNCEQGPTPDPCDVCASCMAIAAGNHEDVLEIDGASNTGVDDVRALQETLSYVPQRSTYKIYIIDEVHMLSISAFNALLKTLEEPPQHVIFIFATTELHKVPETIQSRCQVFHLQKISRPVIAERVRTILEAEGIPFDEAALSIVAREGRGSMRDALTMLDQAIAVGGGQVSSETLRTMVGGSQALPVLELLDGLLRKDAALILEVIARWDQEGLAMAVLVEETVKACRNAFILRDLKGQAIDLQILELEDREQQMLLELGEKALPMDLNRLFRLLAKCLDDLRHADLDRFILENYCLEWCFDPGLPDLQTLMNVVAGGQPMPPSPMVRPAAPTPGEPSVNLRDRWKNSAPAMKSPAVPGTQQLPTSVRPAAPQQANQTSAPSNPNASNAVATPPAGVASNRVAPQASAPSHPYASNAVAPQPVAPANPVAPQAAAPSNIAPQASAPSLPYASNTAPQPVAPANPVAPQAVAPSNPHASNAVAPQPVAPANRPSAPHASNPVTAPQPAAVASSHTPSLASPAAQPLAAPAPIPAPQSAAPAPAAPQPSVAAPHSLASNFRASVTSGPAQPQPTPASTDEAPPQKSASPLSALKSQLRATPPQNSKPAAPRAGAALDEEEEMPPWALAASMEQEIATTINAEPAKPEPAKQESFLQQMARKAQNVANANPPPAPKPEPAPAAEPATLSAPIWPENWRAFVDEWKKQKPLQGRVLEEAYMLEYSLQRIRLAVDPQSMAGGKLLQPDVRKRLSELFTQLFGFQGILECMPKGDANVENNETILTVKAREREVARDLLKTRLEEHPMTREVISRFGGTIEQIEIP